MLTPSEAYQKAKPEEKDLRKLEERIDAAIVDGIKRGSLTASIDAEIFPDYATRQSIIEKYTGAGWKMDYVSDQRDGDFVSIQLNYKKSNASLDYYSR
jgi:hypothetical protein